MSPAVPSLGRSVVDGVVFLVGVVALILAGVVIVGGPGTDSLVAALAPVFGPGWVAVGGLLVGGFAAYTVYERSTGDTHETPAVDVPRPPSRRDRGTARTAGGRVDALVEEIQADDLDRDVSRVDVSVNRERVRDRVRRAAVDVLVDEGHTPEEAGAMLASGEWTDRRRARVFLGDDVARLPLSVRLRDWASGERFRRRAGAAVEELATIAGVDHDESIAPPPVGTDAGRDRSPVSWPPGPESESESEPTVDGDLDRLLDRPVESKSESTAESTSDVDATAESTTFRREIITSDDAPTGRVTAETEGGDPE